jgi:hypothetical protein
MKQIARLAVSILVVTTSITQAQRTLDPAELNPIRIPYEEIRSGKYDAAWFASLSKSQIRARTFERKMVTQLRQLDQRLNALGYGLSTNALTRTQRLERTKYLGGTMTSGEMDQYESGFNRAVQDLATRVSRAEGILEEAKPQPRRQQARAANNNVQILPQNGPGQPGWGDPSRSRESIMQEQRQHQIDEDWQKESKVRNAQARLANADAELDRVKNKAPMGMTKWDDPATLAQSQEETEARSNVNRAQADLNRARRDPLGDPPNPQR